MTLTIDEQRPPESPSPVPPRTSRHGRAALALGAGVAALAATAALVVAVVTDDDTTPNRILTFGVGDAKDHPQYNPPESDTTIDRNLTFGIGDAKDHPRYNP